MIPIYIGISKRFKMIEGMTERSILAHTKADVKITHLYPKHESGCTGFSNVRYTIEHGIYLDSDMIVLGDIAELWEYRKPGKFVCMQDRSTEVAVIDCKHNCRSKSQVTRLPMEASIPLEWNVEDYKYFPDSPLPKDMKLFHFTSLDKQPWLFKHPNKEANELYKKWKNTAPKRTTSNTGRKTLSLNGQKETKN